MKYFSYLEIPGIKESDGTIFRTRLFHFDRATKTGNGGLSGLETAKNGRAPSVIFAGTFRYTDKNQRQIRFPEMRIVTGYVPAEKNFISRFVFTLSDVVVDNPFPFTGSFVGDNSAESKDHAEERAEANSLAERGFLYERLLYAAKTTTKREATVKNYWRSLLTYNR